MPWDMGRKGWPGAHFVLTPAELNTVYTHGKFYVPAGALVPNDTAPTFYETYQSGGTGTNPPTFGVMRLPQGIKSECEFDWGFKADFAAATAASLALKIAPIWFAPTTAAQDVFFHVGAINMVFGDTIDQNENPETTMIKTVPGTAKDITGGITANPQAVPLATVTTTGIASDISGTDWNLLHFNIEREGGNVLDTYTDNVFLIGVGIEFAVDFGNLAAWPTS